MKSKKQMSEATSVMVALTISGGLQDAYSYFVRDKVFANAQTGNIVLMSEHFFSGDVRGGIRYLIPILAFALGVLIAEQLRAKFSNSKLFHWRQLIAAIEILLLFITGLLPVTKTLDPLANALTSCSCAMQVQAFRKVNGYSYASTMCIGNMRSAMESLSAYLRLGEKRLLRQAGQYFFVILMFILGAGAGGIAAQHIGRQLIWASCALLFLCFALMFIKEDIEHEADFMK